jgi:hypothetical protein
LLYSNHVWLAGAGAWPWWADKTHAGTCRDTSVSLSSLNENIFTNATVILLFDGFFMLLSRFF